MLFSNIEWSEGAIVAGSRKRLIIDEPILMGFNDYSPVSKGHDIVLASCQEDEPIYLLLATKEQEIVRRKKLDGGCKGKIEAPDAQNTKVLFSTKKDARTGVALVRAEEDHIYHLVWGGAAVTATFYVVHEGQVHFVDKAQLGSLCQRLGIQIKFDYWEEGGVKLIDLKQWKSLA